jgi:DNA-binding NtrC family response regulator
MEDLPALCRHLIGKANEKLNNHVTKVIRPEVLEKLQAHNWPGNIRELQAVIRRAVAITQSNVLLPSDIEIAPLKAKKNTVQSYIELEQPLVADTPEASEANNLEAQAKEFAAKIDKMEVEKRYAFINGNLDGPLRTLVIIEIVRHLRNCQGRKVRHKDLANYIDVIKDAKKDLERIRQLVVTSAKVKLTELDFNQ